MHDVSVIIPTYNGEPYLDALIPALVEQGVDPSLYLIIDSNSKDNTRERFSHFGARVECIDHTLFDHGGTRRLATEITANVSAYIFLTQDAIPNPHAFARLLTTLDNNNVGMSYGRQ